MLTVNKKAAPCGHDDGRLIERAVRAKVADRAVPSAGWRGPAKERALALNHPNILTGYDTGEHQGTPFIVFEWLEGEDPRAAASRSPRALRERQRLRRVLLWQIEPAGYRYDHSVSGVADVRTGRSVQESVRR